MKRITILASLLLFSVGLLAQNAGLEKMMTKYSSLDGYASIEVGKSMIQALVEGQTDADPAVIANLKQLNTINVLSNKDLTHSLTNEFKKDLHGLFAGGKYEKLLSFTDKGEEVDVYARKNGQSIVELGLIVFNSKENILIHVTGDNIDINTITTLSELDGLGDFDLSF